MSSSAEDADVPDVNNRDADSGRVADEAFSLYPGGEVIFDDWKRADAQERRHNAHWEAVVRHMEAQREEMKELNNSFKRLVKLVEPLLVSMG